MEEKEWEKAKKRKEGKFPNQRVGESKKEKKENSQIKEWEKEKEGKKIPDQGSKENKGNVQKGHWTRRYLNNTELSPNKQKEGKETTI